MEEQITQEGFAELGEIREESNAELMLSLENLIQAGIKESKEVDEQIKKHKEMIDSVLLNEQTYKQHADQAKEAARIKSNTKKEIFKRPDVKPIVEKLKELREQKKDIKTEMSSYLVDHLRIGKQMMFDFEDGQYQVEQEAKLVRLG